MTKSIARHTIRSSAPGSGCRCLRPISGRLGSFCADRRWPETVHTLALQGARVIFNPIYGMHNDLNRCMLRTRAYESEVCIAFTHPGQALITGPRGGSTL
ncbi:MAG: hypothetical protein JXA33_19200 [Anaerolineae bacterium]|nr:hypothetical protein [Anaerolineae bacterium]